MSPSPLLKVNNLSKYFGGVQAVDRASFELKEGELLGFIGPNGSGKTTLLNVISNLIEPDEGKVIFQGQDVTKWAPSRLAKMGLVKSFQVVNLFERMSVLENLKAAVIASLGITHKAFSNLNKQEEVDKKSAELLELFQLSEKADTWARDVPHGDRKVLDVALCFALDPKLILLDEPTSGVGTTEKTQVIQRIEEAVRKRGLTAVVVEHDMDVVFSYSDRVVAMDWGKILAQGKPEEVRDNPDVKKAIMGEL